VKAAKADTVCSDHKARQQTKSFISGGPFQETTRVLTERCARLAGSTRAGLKEKSHRSAA